MLGINPNIVEHEIKMYPNDKPIWKQLRDINPRKPPSIKVEVEKFLNIGFIYSVPWTKWVFNLIPIDKKQ
jgi:hypothetical protein